ncbi:MAG: 3'-5' exonuclease [bacterium]
MNYLFVDTETGGLDADKYSILSLGCAIASRDEILKTLEIKIREPRIVTGGGLNINKIDLNEHAKEAIPPEEVVKKFLSFVLETPDIYRNELGKIILFGHNVYFDISFIRRLFFFTKYNYKDTFSHRNMDTASILKYLHFKDILKEDISSLSAALKYFGIRGGQRHVALDDAVLTAKLFQKLMNLDMTAL